MPASSRLLLPVLLQQLAVIPDPAKALLGEVHREASQEIAGAKDRVGHHTLLRHGGEEEGPEEGTVLLRLLRLLRGEVLCLILLQVEIRDLIINIKLQLL